MGLIKSPQPPQPKGVQKNPVQIALMFVNCKSLIKILMHPFRFGRKKTVIIPMLIAGISCILVAIIPGRPKKGSNKTGLFQLRISFCADSVTFL